MIQTESRTTSLLVAAIKSCVVFFMVVSIVVLSLALATEVMAQKMLLQTGFENDPLDGRNEQFKRFAEGLCGCKITSEFAKTGKKSLAILGNGLADMYSMSIRKTDESIISVEFWVYIKKGGRSLGLKLVSDDAIIRDKFVHEKVPHIGWDAGSVQFYANGGWRRIDKFATDKWRYVRIVADFDRSVFDFYSGNSRHKALRTKLRERIPFRREAAAGSVATEISFSMEGMTAPGYIDDLFVYEGDKPIALAVEPNRKLTTVWGHIKRQ